MKILFVNTNIGYGGATKIMMWLAGRLVTGGDEVTFLTFRDAAENREVPKGVKHVHLQLESGGHSFSGLFKTVDSLHRFIKKGGFDWGVAFLSPSQLRLSLAAIGTSIKLLVSQRGDPYQSEDSNLLQSRIERFAFKRADRFVFQTRQAMEYYDKSIQTRAVVIPNPVKPLKRTCERTPDNRIINVARLDIKQKRQDLLIEAFKMISEEYPEITLHLYGDGDDEVKLKKLAEGQKRIIFEGVTSNIVEEIQNAKMFVLSSDFEGIPNALIEAMSLGVPCISTKCSPGGAELLIEDGKNGLLVSCADVKAIAESMRRFLDKPAEAEKLGKEATSIVHTFSEDKIFNQWYQVIHR